LEGRNAIAEEINILIQFKPYDLLVLPKADECVTAKLLFRSHAGCDQSEGSAARKAKD
jgi:hypothetical protein